MGLGLEAGLEGSLILQTSATTDYKGEATPQSQKLDSVFSIDIAMDGTWLFQILPHSLVII